MYQLCIKNLFSVLLPLCFMLPATAQRRVITGLVTDRSDGSSLPGIIVQIKGTSNGVITNLDGKYAIQVPEGDVFLLFSYIGFEDFEVEVGTRSVIDVALTASTLELEEVVVTALGIARDKKALGFSVQEVRQNWMVESGASNTVDALAGKVSGIQVSRSSGAVGAGSRILVRGVTSLVGNNEPLIVIDGVRTNNEALLSQVNTAGTAQSNRLMDLNVEDIRSLSVLKGAAAAALYGTAGAAGVILIDTKRGEKSKNLKVNLSQTMAFDRVSTLVKTQGIFAQGTGGKYKNPLDKKNGASWGPKIADLEFATDPKHPNAPASENFDADGKYKWDKNGFLVPKGTGNGVPAKSYEKTNQRGFFRTAVSHTTSLSVSGGGDYASFRFSASNMDAQGVAYNEGYKRKTFKLSSDLKATDRITFSSSVNYTRSDLVRMQQGSNTSALLLGMGRTTPTFDNANGFSPKEAANQPSAYMFPDGSQRNYRGGKGYDNPYWAVNNSLRHEFVDRVFGNFKVNYFLNAWANFSLNIGSDFTGDRRKQHFEINSQRSVSGQALHDEYNTNQTDINLMLSGTGSLGRDVELNYLAGMNVFAYHRRNVMTKGTNLVFPGFVDIKNAKSITAKELSRKYRTIGFFGQAEVGWRRTFFMTAGIRQDYDSRLGNPKNFKLADASFIYPSVSASVIFTEFIPNSILSFGKLRLSWAKVGAPPPNPYLTSTNYESVGIGDVSARKIEFPMSGVVGFELDNTLGNSKLTPEFTTSIEIGADLRFFQERIGLDVAYYRSQSTDAVLDASLPPSTGFTNIWMNIGQMDSKGIEITLNANPIKTLKFNWEAQLNFTKNQSIVTKLAPGFDKLKLVGFTSLGIYLVKGAQYGSILGGVYLREGATKKDDKSINLPGGNIVINEDPNSSEYGYEKVDPVQRVFASPHPDFIVGFKNQLNYKRFSLAFLLDWKQGGKMWNGTEAALAYFGTSKLSAETRQAAPAPLRGVKADGTPNDIPIVRGEAYWKSSVGGFGRTYEYFVQDAGWIRLREISFFYKIPDNILGNLFKGGKVGAIARNLWYHTKYTGIDPETNMAGLGNGQGMDYFNMPGTRSLMFKVSLDF